MADTKTETKVKKGRNKYCSVKLKARRHKRRDEAEARQALHDGLKTQEKINKAIHRGGSVRELKRLTALVLKEKEVKKAAPPVEPPKVVDSPKAKKAPYQKPKRS
jgi:plasmid stability protein